MKRFLATLVWSTILFFLLLPIASLARVIRIEIRTTESYQSGKVFGSIGSYERLTGIVYGEVDPMDPHNRIIQDLALAPRNVNGMVEYQSEIIILRPADPRKGNGLLFLSLPNRGNVFPADSALLERGYIYVWCAWQGDVLPGNNRVTMQVPVAKNPDGTSITGPVRCEFQVREKTYTLPLSSGAFSGLTHHSYASVTTSNKGLTLTRRVREQDPRVPIPNEGWAFSEGGENNFPGKPDPTKITLKEGFSPDFIYELVYTAKDPLVLGLGFAAIRDAISFLRRMNGDLNPLVEFKTGKSPVLATIMQGISQCSNFTRTFVQLGFNQDEQNLQVFDGINSHIAPRRISLNIRFGRPGGGGLQHEDHLFPSNEPPFTWEVLEDPVSGINGGMLETCSKSGSCPKVFQTLGSAEYWQLRASLQTTDSYGKKDIQLPENIRMYFFTSTQHVAYRALDPATGFYTNHNSYWPELRVLLIRLEEWVMKNIPPPPSVYPTIQEGTLVRPSKSSLGWPDIPEVPFNGLVNHVPLLDFGKHFDRHHLTGYSTMEPPRIIEGKGYTVLVPKVDKDGNEIAGIKSVTLLVPLGTYTGWSIRKKGFGEGDLNSLNGMFIPFAKTKAERIKSGDPRLSLEERYGNFETYLQKIREAASQLVKDGYLLPEDARTEIEMAEKNNPFH